MIPTDIGIVVNDYLVDHFDRIMDYNFTAKVEEEFDRIADGEIVWNSVLKEFYGPFHSKVQDAIETEGKVTGERELGIDPESGRKIIARIGRFGPMIQIGESGDEANPPKFASIPAGGSITTITLDEALALFELPKVLGQYKGQDAEVAIGRFGPYVKYDGMFVSLDRGEDPMNVSLDRAIELIEAKIQADAPIAHYEKLPVQKGVGRFGPFIKWNDMFINVSKKYDYDNLTDADIKELIELKRQKDIDKVIHNWKDEGIRVEKARWGRTNILKGKTKIELPKTVDAAKLSLDEVKAIIEKNAPKKKAAKKKAAPKKSAAKKK
jgi:DNA topoisomerase-1